MLNRIIGMVFWLGVAALVAVAGLRFLYPAKDQYVPYLLYAGLVCLLIYVLGQWRDIVSMFARRQARYGALTGVSVLVVLGILDRHQLHRSPAEQALGPDHQQAIQPVRSDAQRAVASSTSPLQITVFAQEENFGRFKERLKEYEYVSKKVSTDYVDPDKKPALASQNQIQQYGTILFAYKGRTERVTSDAEQDITTGIIKVVQGQTKKVYFTKGHGEKDTASAERDGYKSIADGLGRDNYSVESVVSRRRAPSRTTQPSSSSPDRRSISSRARSRRSRNTSASRASCCSRLDPPEKPDSPPLPNLMALAHEWGIDSATTSSWT